MCHVCSVMWISPELTFCCVCVLMWCHSCCSLILACHWSSCQFCVEGDDIIRSVCVPVCDHFTSYTEFILCVSFFLLSLSLAVVCVCALYQASVELSSSFLSQSVVSTVAWWSVGSCIVYSLLLIITLDWECFTALHKCLTERVISKRDANVTSLSVECEGLVWSYTWLVQDQQIWAHYTWHILYS